MSHVRKLHKKGLIKPPPFVVGGIQYETIMGSEAYGVSSGDSDRDVYGFCIPPKDYIFPQGYVLGFGTKPPVFNQWQQHHVEDKSDRVGGAPREYDFSIYNIVKYFQLCMENNPNMVDSLFTPQRCVLHATKIAQMVRENRRMFLHQGAKYKFLGYAHSQLKKIKNKDMVKFVDSCRQLKLDPEGDLDNIIRLTNSSPMNGDMDPMTIHRSTVNRLVKDAKKKGGWGKRLKEVATYGYSVKFGYHLVRLLGEAEQILTEGDLDITRDRERLKAIRRGEWSLTQLEDWFNSKEKALEKAAEESKLPKRSDEERIKQLLLDCLEEYYGDLSSSVVQPDRAVAALRKISEEIDKVRGVL